MEYKNSNCYKFFSEFDEEEVDTLVKIVNNSFQGGQYKATNKELEDLFINLVDISCDAGYYEHRLGSILLKGNTTIVSNGSGEYSSEESTTNLHMHLGDKELCEICYDVGNAHCCESQLLSFEVIPNEELVMETDEAFRTRVGKYWRVNKAHFSPSDLAIATGEDLDNLANLVGLKRKGDKTLAKLSKRVYDPDEVRVTFGDKEIKGFSEIETQSKSTHTHHIDGDKSNNSVDNLQFVGTMDTDKPTNGENNMTVQTLNITLVDNNTNLKGEDKIVFQKIGFITEHSEADAKMDLIATGKVLKALNAHNTKRGGTIDKAILRATGRDVYLEEIELLSDPELQWQVVRSA